VADLTIEGLDELDALRKAYEAALAAGNAYEEWKAWQRALMKAVGGPTWPSVSAMLRRALVTAPAAVPGLAFGEPDAEGETRDCPDCNGTTFTASGNDCATCDGTGVRAGFAPKNAHNAARLAKKGGE